MCWILVDNYYAVENSSMNNLCALNLFIFSGDLVHAVTIAGTQTPNCIRATAYDSDMNDFDTVMIQDCISSKTSEVQEANIRDFINAGFNVLDSSKFIANLDSYTKESPKYQAIVRDLSKRRTRRIKA